MSNKSILLMLLLPSTVFAAPCAVVQSVTGPVEAVTAGRHSPLKTGDSLACGTQVISKDNGSLMTYFNDGKLVVGPKSFVTLNGPAAKKRDDFLLSDPNYEPGLTMTSVALIFGNVRVATSRGFTIEAPHCQVGVTPKSDVFVGYDSSGRTLRTASLGGEATVLLDTAVQPLEVKRGYESMANLDPLEGANVGAPTPLSRDLRQLIRHSSVIAKSEQTFTRRPASSLLGKPVSWNKSEEEEQHDLKAEQTKRQEQAQHEAELKRLRGSWFEHQADGKKFEIMFYPQVGDFTVPASAYSSNSIIAKVGIAPEYGLNDTFSVGAIIAAAYQHNVISVNGSSSTSTAQGLTDPSLFLNGRLVFGEALFKFGVYFTSSLGSAGGSTSNGVAQNDGYTISPFLGLEYGFAQNRIGLRVSDDILRSNRSVSVNGDTSKITGGLAQKFVLFYERALDKADRWGFDVGFTHISSESGDVSGLDATTQSLVANVLNSNGSTIPQIEGYFTLTQDKFTLVPTIGYSTMQAIGAVMQGFYVEVPIRVNF